MESFECPEFDKLTEAEKLQFFMTMVSVLLTREQIAFLIKQLAARIA